MPDEYYFIFLSDDSDVIDTVDSPKHQAKMKTKSYKMTIYWVSFLDGQQRVVLFTCDKQIAEAARLVINIKYCLHYLLSLKL